MESKRNILGCVEKLIDVISNDYTKDKEEEKWNAYKEAKDDLYSGYLEKTCLEQYNGDKEIKSKHQLCKSIVKAIVSQSADIGKLNIRQRKDQFLTKNMERKEKKLARMKDNVYIVILFLCGDDTENDEESVNKFLKEFRYAMNRNAKVIVKIVLLNKVDDNCYTPLTLKDLLQTVNIYERKPIYYANKRNIYPLSQKKLFKILNCYQEQLEPFKYTC